MKKIAKFRASLDTSDYANTVKKCRVGGRTFIGADVYVVREHEGKEVKEFHDAVITTAFWDAMAGVCSPGSIVEFEGTLEVPERGEKGHTTLTYKSGFSYERGKLVECAPVAFVRESHFGANLPKASELPLGYSDEDNEEGVR